MTYENKALTNRGFVRGPFCIIYGLGALSVYFILQPIAHHYLAIFLCGMVMSTVLELITAKIMTRLFGGFWWDYNNKRFNYHGVICLESSLCWGAMSLCTFIIFQPTIERIVDTYYTSYGRAIAIVLLLVYTLDFMTSFYHAHHANGKTKQSETDDEQSVTVHSA
jgi:uncharacterized membrane protein